MSDVPQDQDGPRGVSGWLILPLLLLIVMIFAATLQMMTFPDLAEVAGSLPTFERYIVSVQVLLNAIVGILCPIVLLVLLARKKRIFPRLFVAWTIAYTVYAIGNRIVVQAIFGPMMGASWDQLLSAGALQSLIISILPVLIFIPYMWMSRRVRNTFVN